MSKTRAVAQPMPESVTETVAKVDGSVINMYNFMTNAVSMAVS